MKDGLILVVEDSRTQAAALQSLLEQEGSQVQLAGSGEEALEWLQGAGARQPDLVLSDVVMPGITGYELTRRLKTDERYQHIPVVLLTSLTDPLDIVRGLECGADNYVTKPYDPEYLVARVRHVLAQKRLRRGLRAALGVNVHFLGTTFTITSDREQILDLFLSSVEDVVRTNSALEQSQQELAEAQRQLEAYARQMALRAETSAEHLRTVLEASPVAIVAFDREGKVTVWNPAAERIFGYTAAEALQDNDKITPPDRRAEFDRMIAAAQAGQVSRMETERAGKNGRRIPVALSLAALRDTQGAVEGYVATFEDITERRRQAEALAASQAQLIQAQKMEAIGTLAGGVAHDFNNLLTVMRSYGSMLVEDLPKDATDPRHYAEEILSAADRAAALTRQLLAFSRKEVLQPRLVRVDDVVKGVEQMIRRLIPANLPLELELRADDALVQMDPGQLEQILLNLVINASHAMPGGGKIVVATKSVKVPQPRDTLIGPLHAGRHVSLTVTDTGTGMDQETLQRIFEPFFTTKPAGTGTGLGLPIVRSIVADQKGGIDVHTTVGVGTTFDVFLPQSAEAASDDVVSAADVPAGRETILVVDDDVSVRAAVRAALERFGYTVLDAQNGAQAMHVASMMDAPPDLVVTDLMMPEVTGRELVQQLQKLGRTPRVLLMSGYANDEIMRRGLALREYPFIQKPFTREELARKVREVLDAPAGDSSA